MSDEKPKIDNAAAAADVKPAVDDKKDAGAHINIKVASSDGSEVFFKVKRTTPFRKIIDAFCQRQGKEAKDVRFQLDGTRVEPEDTPESLDMEDNDKIDAMVTQVGGCY